MAFKAPASAEATTRPKKTASAEATASAVTRRPSAPQQGQRTADASEQAGRSPAFHRAMELREQSRPRDAIAELEKARKASGDAMSVPSLKLMGQCQIDDGDHVKAISTFKNALFHPDVTQTEFTALLYELGRAHESLGDQNEALHYYRRLAKTDATFRDTAARINALTGSRGPHGR